MNFQIYNLNMYVDCIPNYFYNGNMIYVDNINYFLDDIENDSIDVVEQDMTQMKFLIDA